MAAPTFFSAVVRTRRCPYFQGLQAVLRPHIPAAPTSCVVVRTKKRMFIPKQANRSNKEFQEDPAAAMKRQGIVPDDKLDRQVNISCTPEVMDPYIPPEGDGRQSVLSKEGAVQRLSSAKALATSQISVRKIKEFDKEFSTKTFAGTAQEIYKEAHDCLANFNTRNRHRLHQLVTEKCYPDMVRGFRFRTIHWTFHESVEPPKVVHVRHNDLITKGNVYGQVTVRMHTRQTLAIYDKFGRLEFGDENLVKDVLEYVVFERHLPNPYSSWRMHTKIVPSWAPPKEPVIRTMFIPTSKKNPWDRAWDSEDPVPTPSEEAIRKFEELNEELNRKTGYNYSPTEPKETKDVTTTT
ncbi:39S ribosomal protein L45, mitochondrial [Branchiostoma belcheri]|nr:39S ribosomal protein L45, mitochondrial [Branchiostoma belcheri]